jgi:hypothetical protein
VSPRGACSRCSSGAAEPWTFIYLLLQVGAKVQPRAWQRLEAQPPSRWGRVVPPLRRRVEVEQRPRRRARDAQSPSRAQSVQPPSRARRTAQ